MAARRTCGGKDYDEAGQASNCPALAEPNDSLCAKHKKIYESKRGSSSQRGYDARHFRTRARLLRELFRRPPQDRLCPLCGEMMLESERGSLHLDHSVPLAIDPTSRGDRIVHAACNLSRPRGMSGSGM